MAGLQLKAALDLIRRLPPAKIESSLADLCDLAPDLTDDLLSTIDQPLQLERDSSARDFLLCDYNRDGDSYRYALRARPALLRNPCSSGARDTHGTLSHAQVALDQRVCPSTWG